MGRGCTWRPQARNGERVRAPLLVEQRAQVRVAAAITCAAKDIDTDLASGATDTEAVAEKASADEGLQRGDSARELERDGESGSG